MINPQRRVVTALVSVILAHCAVAQPRPGAVPDAAAPPAAVSYEYKFPPPAIEATQGIAQVTVDGCDVLNRPGDPALPFRTARILLPPGHRLVSAEARPLGEPVLLPGVWRLEPGRKLVLPQRPVHARPRPQTSDQAPGPKSSARALQPAARAQLASVQRLFGCDIALVRLFPLQYAQASGELWFAPRLQVTLTLAPIAGTPPPAVSLPAYARERVAAFVDNPAVLADGRFARSAGTLESAERCDYLLVTKQSLLPAFQPLLDSKRQAGLAARAEAIETIQSGQPGRDLPEKLRNYIRYACTNWGVQYVLLGGDVATVPCRYAYVRMNEKEVDSYLPCDLYYACLDGSWNRDGDKRWGEPTDGEDGGDVDLLAEVWVGRAPVDSPTEASSFVEKTLHHEREADSHRGAVLVSAEYLGRYSPNIEAQGGHMFEPLLPRLGSGSIRWLDDRPHTTPQWSNSQAIAALNESPRFVLYNGHGDSDTLMRLRRADLDGLTNARPFLVYSVGCHAGHFDNDQFSPDSIAEELIKRDRHGAFAAIFNPRLGWFDPHAEWKFSGEFQIKFFEALAGRGQIPLGAANHASKHDMLGHVEDTGIMPYRWCCYEITLFGDPHTPVSLSPHIGRQPAGWHQARGPSSCQALPDSTNPFHSQPPE